MDRALILLDLDLKSAVAALQVNDRFSLSGLTFSPEKDPIVIELAEFLGLKQLYWVPFSPDNSLLSKGKMLKLAEFIAEREFINCLVTGENLPLISSTHLEAINFLNSLTKLKVIRPIFSLTEEEILQIAKEHDLTGSYSPSSGFASEDFRSLGLKLMQAQSELREIFSRTEIIEF
jgi:hypothetical protein